MSSGPPGGQYVPGQVVNGHILGLDGTWHGIMDPPPPPPTPPPPSPPAGPPRYDPTTGMFHGSLPDLIRLGVRAVQSLGWTVTDANDNVGLLVFETGISWGSWSGIKGSITFSEVSAGAWHASGTGKQNLRGAQLVAIDFGEADSKARKVIEEMVRLVGEG
jgi:hypothetical protein